MNRKLLTTMGAALIAAMFVGTRAAWSQPTPSPSPKPTPSGQGGVLSNTYYDKTVGDATVRVTNYSGGDRCALFYVTDQDQEIKECCGCPVSEGGTLILSVDNDLTANPANNIATTVGSIALLSSASSPTCATDGSAPKPTPELSAWSTHQQSNELTEEEFTPLWLSLKAEASLKAECAAIQLISSGKGICTCGAGPA